MRKTFFESFPVSEIMPVYDLDDTSNFDDYYNNDLCIFETIIPTDYYFYVRDFEKLYSNKDMVSVSRKLVEIIEFIENTDYEESDTYPKIEQFKRENFIYEDFYDTAVSDDDDGYPDKDLFDIDYYEINEVKLPIINVKLDIYRDPQVYRLAVYSIEDNFIEGLLLKSKNGVSHLVKIFYNPYDKDLEKSLETKIYYNVNSNEKDPDGLNKFLDYHFSSYQLNPKDFIEYLKDFTKRVLGNNASKIVYFNEVSHWIQNKEKEIDTNRIDKRLAILYYEYSGKKKEFNTYVAMCENIAQTYGFSFDAVKQAFYKDNGVKRLHDKTLLRYADQLRIMLKDSPEHLSKLNEELGCIKPKPKI